MQRKLDPTNTFSIAFNTEEMPGKITIVTVELTKEIVALDGAFEGRKFRVDLCDHPLYPQLAAYVSNNPANRRG